MAVDYDPGASEVNQLNRIKLMLATARKNLTASAQTGPRLPFLAHASAEAPD